MLIGLTDPMTDRAKTRLYASWLKSGGSDVEVALLSCTVQNAGLLERCDALVLSGGGDMHPQFFGRPDLLALCDGVDEERDVFELELIKRARKRSMPVLGICRGAQVLNVAFGGSLIVDIEKAGFVHHRTGDAVQRLHPIVVEEGTMLHTVACTTSGTTNTFHHQAVERPGEGLRVSARSHDGVVEAIEPVVPGEHPFLFGVQWHPERMKDAESPFSAGVLRSFLHSAGK